MKAKHKTLGLKKGASQEEIQEAYDRLSKELDPVTNNNETFFVEQFAKVKVAYSALMTKKKHDEEEIPVKRAELVSLNSSPSVISLVSEISSIGPKKCSLSLWPFFFGVFLSLAVDQKRREQ